jgi:hypothetical protein
MKCPYCGAHLDEDELEEDREKYSLVGIDGNAFAVMAYVSTCMKYEHKTKDEIDAYLADAKSSDYNHLLCVSQEMIEQLNKG